MQVEIKDIISTIPLYPESLGAVTFIHYLIKINGLLQMSYQLYLLAAAYKINLNLVHQKAKQTFI